MRFGLLGEVRAWRPDGPVDIGHSRQGNVLAALLFDANRLVSADQLLDRVWGEHPPPTARGTLSTYLTRLRQALTPVPIERRPGGYQITVEPGALDLDRFTELVARAGESHDDQLAARAYEQAFALWRGEPLPRLDTPWANDTRALLTRQRYAADLDHTDVRLRLGEHAGLLAGLAARAGEHPLDERVAGQLIIALSRSGRQADAITHYQDFQRRLAEELGTDPGPALRELHQQLLADRIVHVPGRAKPRQLPPAPRPFTGRVAELASLSARLDTAASTVVISAIGGGGGIGKTSLALHWAHLHADRFPDGQLFVNLRGFDPSGEPTAPSSALRGFLIALGVTDIPSEVDEQAGLYRSLVAGRRMLVVLDNAAGTAQVGPLLPGSATVTTLVTSRNPLTGLVVTHGATAVPLDVLTDDEARELLAQRLGPDRLAAEPSAMAELVKHCGGLPLALGIVAARAIVSPDTTLTELAAQLRSHTLDGLDTGEEGLNLRAVFALSHRALSPETARLACLLGVAPGPDISLAAASALAGQDAAPLLRELEAAHLISEAGGRYRMHDLVRLDAAERALLVDDALRRLVDFYLRTGQAADRLLDPRRPPFTISGPVLSQPLALSTDAEALAWLNAEHPCLLATQRLADNRGWHAQAWEVSFVTDTLHSRQGLGADHLAVLRLAVAAAQAEGDLAVQARLHANLGQSAARSGLADESVHHLERVIDLTTRTGDDVLRGHAHNSLAQAYGERGDNDSAWHHAARALEQYRAAGNPMFEAQALNQLGWVEALLGRFDDAREHCLSALDIQRAHGHLTGEAQDSLGYIEEQSGRLAEAVAWYREAVAVFEEHGDLRNVATTLIQLGRACVTAAQLDDATTAWRRALDLCRAQGRAAEADRLEQRLAQLIQ